MRAATALVSALKDTGGNSRPAQVWRADELSLLDGIAPVIASGFAALDRELPGGGWPQGQLTELLLDAPGYGELSLLAPALAQISRDGRACVWVLPSDAPDRRERNTAQAAACTPYPPALIDAGIDPARSIFVRPATARESWWALEQSLRAAHLGAVIGWLPAGSAEADFRALRRLHLLAGRHRALAFVLRAAQAAAAPSPAALRLQLAQHDGLLQVQVLKRRGRPLLEPVSLQVHPARWRAARIDPAPNAAAATDEPRSPIKVAPRLPARRWSLQAIFSH
jgi:hypothetical protein